MVLKCPQIIAGCCKLFLTGHCRSMFALGGLAAYGAGRVGGIARVLVCHRKGQKAAVWESSS